jgi:FkbH-like protein
MARLEDSMRWLATTDDFRGQLQKAKATADADDRLAKLADLAQFRLGYLEIIQLDSALRAAIADSATSLPRVRVALLSSSTVDHLGPSIRIAGLRRRTLFDVHIGAYGQYRQELLDPASAVAEFAPQIVLLSLSASEAIAGVPIDATADEADRAIRNAVNELRELWRRARKSLHAGVVQQSFLDTSEQLFGSLDRLLPGAPARLIARLNDLVADAAVEEGVMFLDIARSAARDGLNAWFDVTRWLQGKMEIAPQSAPMYGDLVGRLIAAQLGQSKKCLVLDLDNTLWGGVIGDDGVEGIHLGQGSAIGEAHLALQRYAKRMKDRGIILAVCSKNDSRIAEAAFSDHPEMALKRSDFAAFVTNWNDKAENLKSIAEQLNIGLDSLVFVDDNPVERARVRETLPMVAVPELPLDPAHYVGCIADAGYFEAISFTQEDRERASQYTANAEREALRGTTENMDDFLRNLNMTVTFGPIGSVDLARATQLINKTNQFNTTTRRYTVDEVASLAADPQAITLQFRLADRFGDNGLVSVMLIAPSQHERDALEIKIWVMSCRVFGRELEFEAMNIAFEAARDRGARTLHADYLPTKKNVVISQLFESLGFDSQPASDLDSGGSRWRLSLSEYRPRQTQIARTVLT